jgi:hypothetical protein
MRWIDSRVDARPPNHVDGLGRHEPLVAHELAHQWFGNSLTRRSGQKSGSTKGFACYAEWIWTEKLGGPSAHAVAQRQWARVRRALQDLLPADPGPDLMFDDRVLQARSSHVARAAAVDREFGVLRVAARVDGRHRKGLARISQWLAVEAGSAGADAVRQVALSIA